MEGIQTNVTPDLPENLDREIGQITQTLSGKFGVPMLGFTFYGIYKFFDLGMAFEHWPYTYLAALGGLLSSVGLIFLIKA